MRVRVAPTFMGARYVVTSVTTRTFRFGTPPLADAAANVSLFAKVINSPLLIAT